MTHITPNRKRFAIGVVIAGLAGFAWVGWRLSHASATPPQVAPSAEASAATTTTTTAPTLNADGTMPTISTITFTTSPPARASVTWGKTLLGRIAPHAALVVTRPRDSGSLDVTVRANGFLPVHTRAHTFGDTTVSVKLTRPEAKDTLFVYKAPLDAGVPEDEALSALPTAADVQAPPL